MAEEISGVSISNRDNYGIKDPVARANKIDKYEDSEVPAIVNFLNGIQIKGCDVYYDQAADTVYFS